ncbi:MAG: N-acetylglucosamine kinase [Ktedonobacterales bacterium]
MSQPERTASSAGRYFLGVDGGGSKTLAVVVDAQGVERGRALAGSSNYAAVGLNDAVGNVYAAAERAAEAASTSLPVEAVWLGIAGIDTMRAHDLLLAHFRGLAGSVRLTNDAELVLGGLEGMVGVALIAGTGSIALGRNAQGEARRAGGWGHVLGDEGSGYTLGRSALQAATRASDGRGEATTLLPAILQEWGLTEASDMLTRVYPEVNKKVIAGLSSLVLRAAEAGDEVAGAIVREAAEELALAATTVGRALGFGSAAFPLALGGGLLLHEHAFREDVLRQIRQRQTLRAVTLVTEPALSAAQALAQA